MQYNLRRLFIICNINNHNIIINHLIYNPWIININNLIIMHIYKLYIKLQTTILTILIMLHNINNKILLVYFNTVS